MGGEDGARNGRIRIHPAVLQAVGAFAIFIASLVTGYYSGKSDQDNKTASLAARVYGLELQTKELHDNLADIKADVKELLRRAR